MGRPAAAIGLLALVCCAKEAPAPAPVLTEGQPCSRASGGCAAGLGCLDGICTARSCWKSADCSGSLPDGCYGWICSPGGACEPHCPPPLVEPDAAVRDRDGGAGPTDATRDGDDADTPPEDASADAGPEPVCDPDPRAPEEGDLMINEILADPAGSVADGDANGDGVRSATEDEFIEIVNVSDSTLDLDGVVVSDTQYIRHIFTATTTLGCGEAIVVFGGGDPASPAWRASWVVASEGGLSLNNGGDQIDLGTSLESADDIASLAYGAEGDADASLVRETELDPDATMIRHPDHPSAHAKPFSPGTRVDGAPF